MKTEIVGLIGRMSAGKSSVANVLVREYAFKEFSFAGPLKKLAGLLFRYEHGTLYGPSAARNHPDARGGSSLYWADVRRRAADHRDAIDALFEAAGGIPTHGQIDAQLDELFRGLESLGPLVTPRVVLQRVGTEFGRALWGEVWLHAAMQAIRASGAERAVLADCRFENEAAFVRKHGGVTWFVDADARLPANDQFAHASEVTRAQAAPWTDVVLDNNGPVDDLPARVRGAFAASADLRCAA